jgi:hypothetical protein
LEPQTAFPSADIDEPIMILPRTEASSPREVRAPEERIVAMQVPDTLNEIRQTDSEPIETAEPMIPTELTESEEPVIKGPDAVRQDTWRVFVMDTSAPNRGEPRTERSEPSVTVFRTDAVSRVTSRPDIDRVDRADTGPVTDKPPPINASELTVMEVPAFAIPDTDRAPDMEPESAMERVAPNLASPWTDNPDPTSTEPEVLDESVISTNPPADTSSATAAQPATD